MVIIFVNDWRCGETFSAIKQVVRQQYEVYHFTYYYNCCALVHYRGKVCYRFWRQLSDHSTFTRAPLMALCTFFSACQIRRIYARDFPELAILQKELVGYS